ncbi:MAG: TraB/GumN family protein [Bacteroidota bacterium]
MRHLITFILVCFSPSLFAQEKNSLLWEISGNGLQETSYLYGTMHVSKKIAFRLDDVFYEALDQSKMVALESDPNTWLESEQTLGNTRFGNNSVTKGFYTYSFGMKNPRKEDLASYLAFEDRLVNNILYRTNEFSQNFEEETYLDMFIYQAGQKFGKPIIALEDLEESSALVGRASLNAIKQKPDEWLQKKMRQQDPMFLMQDAYRERNINLLDSIDQAMYTEHYLENMLYIRNENMAVRLDSVMRKGKVFTGIGAAHLPGKKGVISMLRDMGYTVKPLVSRSTTKGRKLKEKFEAKIRENTYENFGPDDGFFSIDLPNKLYPVSEYINTTYISPDLANGSYFMVNRIPTFSFLKKEAVYTIDDIDKLLFENIPGKITEKTQLLKNSFQGLDVKNKLKNGDHQRYHIYVTPLEIIIFKMGGEGDYVTQHSDTIFNSIQFKKIDKQQVVLSSGYKDFEILMPSLHRFPNIYRRGNRLVEGYDTSSESYYFLRKASLSDLNFIEEDTFELKQIQKRFYQDLKLEPSYDEIGTNSLTSHTIFDSIKKQHLYLKTTFSKGDYYLLGALTKNKEQANTFFDSFKLQNPIYKKPFERVTDTAMLFSTVSTVKPPKFVESSNSYYNGRKKPKPYAAYNKKTVYQNKNNEAIKVEVNKSHDYLMFSSIDSVWALRKKIYAHKKFNIINEKSQTVDKKYHELQLTLTDTASTRGIMIKNIVKDGLLYEVKALVDTIGKPSKFITAFFENFKPKDTVIGRSILEDKTPDFFTALRANDSIILGGHRFLVFNEKHIDSLKHYISKFNFKDDKKYIQSYLIQKLGQLKDPNVNSFFKDFYLESYNNSSAQTKILQAVSKKADEASTSLLLELMSKDLPLVSNKFEIYNIFRPYQDSLPLAKKLYPEILEYSAIEEYKSPIFSMLAKLKANGLIKPKSYKKYRKQILNDAKIQLKRQLGKYTHVNGRRNFNKNLTNGVLEDYVILLHPFIQEKEIRGFFNRLQLVKDPKIQSTYIALQAKIDNFIPYSIISELAADINGRNILFNKLREAGKLDYFPSKYKTQQSLAEAAIFDVKKFVEAKDTLVFLNQKSLQYRSKKYTGYYFKHRDKQDYDKNFKMHLVVFKETPELQSKPFYKNNGMRIEDADTDQEVIDVVTEEFTLKDRKRAVVYKPNQYNGFGFHGY